MAGMKLESIYPTLFIGLGGAGGHVLGRLNRLFRRDFGPELERAGDASPLQFLLLDTDDFEKLDGEVREGLGSAQQSFLSLSHFNPRRYAESQLDIRTSDLHRWFDREALRYLEDATIHDGASRLRLLGRLCLHYAYERVEQRIREKLNSAMSAAVQQHAERVRPEPRPLRIYLVASSCGGTGSGIFLDVAAMVNRIARERGTSPDVQGFVYLPFPFIEANAQIDPALEPFYQHNAWAFFEELNFFLAEPERIPEFALDPNRRFGEPARAARQFGMDLFRTVYLIGNHVPPLGTLQLGNELHSYVANGIFHTFLTPEEGSIQSHYSNIKAKLKDRDQIYDAPKRFATFGYAEYRRRDDAHAERLASGAVRADWDRILGVEPDADAARAEARTLLADTERRIGEQRAHARDWTPEDLSDASAIVKRPEDTERVSRLLRALPSEADREADAALTRLADDATSAVRGALEQRLAERAADPLHGLLRETRVLTMLRELLANRAGELQAVEPEPALARDEDLGKEINDLAGRFPRPRRKWGVAGETVVDEKKVSEASAAIGSLIDTLRRRSGRRLEAHLQQRLGRMLADEIDPLLQRRVREIDQAVAQLQHHRPREERRDLVQQSPTIQDVPPANLLRGGEFAESVATFRSEHETAVAPGRQEIWQQLWPRLAQGNSGAAAELEERLSALWSRQVERTHGDKGIREWITDWADQIAKRAEAEPGVVGKTTESIERELYARLVAFSVPACPLDRVTFDKADTIAQIPAVVGPFEDERDMQDTLGLSGAASLIESPGASRVAVLQTYYAFASRAVEGMETLRRSYLNRDRANSLPHLSAEWNEYGLSERVDEAARFTAGEYRHMVRVLALSGFFARPSANGGGNGNGSAAPGLLLERDARDPEPPFLLRYEYQDGVYRLESREVRPIEGYRDAWRLLYRPELGHRRALAAAGSADPYQDLGAYLGSRERQSHAELLDDLDRLERDPRLGQQYLDAYKEYQARLERSLATEREQRRERYLPLLTRLADELHNHIDELSTSQAPPLYGRPADA